MKYTAAFCSLNDVARQFLEAAASQGITATEQGIIDSWDTAQAAFYKQLILDVSDKIGTLWQYSFVPFQHTYTVYAQDREWCGWWQDGTGLRYYLTELPYADALAIESISLDGTAQSTSVYRLWPNNSFPGWGIAFDKNSVSIPSGTGFDTSIAIEGTWGYHENPARMWKVIGTVPAGGLSDSATSITSDPLDGLAEIYGYWQIEDETVFITDVNTTSHVITIERGVLGTTAADHAEGASIKKFMPMPQVIMAVRRAVVLLDNKKVETGDITVVGDTTLQVAGESIKLDIPRKLYWGAV
jgi:hypothetical protein